MRGNSDGIVTLDEMEENGNDCNPAWCLRCDHAEMLHVMRSDCYVRCGCKTCKHFGTWSSGGYPHDASGTDCPDFSEIRDELRKRQVNLAWIVSCTRLVEHFRPPAPRPVCIGDPFLRYHIPFPELAME